MKIKILFALLLMTITASAQKLSVDGWTLQTNAVIKGTLSVSNALVVQANAQFLQNVASTLGQFFGNGGGLTNLPATSSTYHRYDLVKDFGATNDGFCFNNITIANGSANLTATGFSPAESGHTSFTVGDSIVGKVICIYAAGGVNDGAGGTNVCFTTTVASVTDGTHLVLASPVVTGGTTLTVGGVIGSDNTLAIQNALNVISNSSSEIVFPPGIYVVNGAPQWTNNSQLRIPPMTNSGAGFGIVNRTLKLTGQFPGFIAQSAIAGQGPFGSSGAMVWSTATNLLHGSVLDCQNFTNATYTSLNGIGGTNNTFANNITILIDGINWRACWNNNGYLLALHGAGSGYLKNSRIDTGYTLYNVPRPFKQASPTYRNEASWGLTVPSPSSAGPFKLDNVEVSGFYHGMNSGEHVYGNVQIESCEIGLDLSTYPGGGGHCGQMLCDFEACHTNVFNEGLPLAIDVIATTETSGNASDWTSTGAALVSDVSSATRGSFVYENTSGLEPVTYNALQLDIKRKGTISQSTNVYGNFNTLFARNTTFGVSSDNQAITFLSAGLSLWLNNTSPFYDNEIVYSAGPGQFWVVGTPGITRGDSAPNDLMLSTFADRGALTPTFIGHYATGQLETRGGFLGTNTTVARGSVLWTSNSPINSLVYSGTNAPGNGHGTDISNGAIGGTNLLQIDALLFPMAAAVGANGNFYSSNQVVAGGGFLMGPAGTSQTPINTNFTAYSSGTVYTMTASFAQVVFGTTSPTVTFNNGGTYLVYAGANFTARGATYAATNTVSIKLRKTTGTPADLINSTISETIPIITTVSEGLGELVSPPVVFTASAADVVQLQGTLSATPAAGNVICDAGYVVAIRIY